MTEIVWHGQMADATQACATICVEFALVLFASSLTLSLAACVWPVAGPFLSSTLAVLFVFLFLAVWYDFRRRQTKTRFRETRIPLPVERPVETPLAIRMRDVLTEARIILPGAQVMLGFQMGVFLTKAFAELPASSQWSHLVAVLLLLVSIILLMGLPHTTASSKKVRKPNACMRFVNGSSSSLRFLFV
jgi:hypothetical protein